jgi:hypothetical protein
LIDFQYLGSCWPCEWAKVTAPTHRPSGTRNYVWCLVLSGIESSNFLYLRSMSTLFPARGVLLAHSGGLLPP